MDIPNFVKQDCLSFELLTFRTKSKQRKDFKHKKLNSDFPFQHITCTICVYLKKNLENTQLT